MPLFPELSPKNIALARWREVQRPQYMVKIELERRKDKAKSVHSAPNVVQNCLIYNLPTDP
jgi:hypothetical protein